MIGECIVARGWQRVNYIQQQFSHSVSHPGTQAAHAASSGPACHSEGVTRLGWYQIGVRGGQEWKSKHPKAEGKERGNGAPPRAWQGACFCLPSCLARNAEPAGESSRAGAAPGRKGRRVGGALDASRSMAGRRGRCRGHAGLRVRVRAQQLRLAL